MDNNSASNSLKRCLKIYLATFSVVPNCVSTNANIKIMISVALHVLTPYNSFQYTSIHLTNINITVEIRAEIEIEIY